MPDVAPGSSRSGGRVEPPLPGLTGPICRAAPTRLVAPDTGPGRSRRWLIVGSIVVAALLAGASVALAATGSGSTTAARAVAALVPARVATRSAYVSLGPWPRPDRPLAARR
jgi:hypothetical protein